MNGAGASSAASGIHVWNGTEPALETAPIESSTIASAPIAPIGRCVSCITSAVWAPVNAMPNSRHRSVIPTMMNIFVAVLNAPGEPSAIMPKVVPSSPSQKKSSTTRWSASTMPLAIASEISR